jgi:hypothetical protein
MSPEASSRQAALFLQLVLGLQQSGMMSLGKLMNPLTRKVESNLELAKDTIDTLASLEARTQGNLESDEARVLQQVLTELRMNYVDEMKKIAEKKEKDSESSPKQEDRKSDSATEQGAQSAGGGTSEQNPDSTS